MRNKQLTVPFIQNGIHGKLMITLFKNRKFAIIVGRQNNVCG